MATDSARDFLHRLVGAPGASALEALRNVAAESTELEDFRPMSESLEWRLADAYWASAGVLPLVRNDVPYLVNNTGRLSENAAALVFAAFRELGASLPERLTILELGAGTGLHARFFLDAFLALCRSEGADFYDRLTYVVSDRFEGTVARWKADGVFLEHLPHVALRSGDARSPAKLLVPDGGLGERVSAPLVVFCNYILDVLPSTIARRTTTGLEQLCVRTHVAGGEAALRGAGLPSLEQARALASSGEDADLARLLPLLPQFDLETAFRPWTPTGGAEESLAAAIPEGERTIVNGAALACLVELLNLTHASGFVLLNDYGPVRATDVATHLGVQRFGGSVALGLNFSALEQALGARGFTIAAPPGDDQRRVHTRLIGRAVGDRTRDMLATRLALETDQHLDAPQEDARGHVTAGRRNEALQAYRALIAHNPRDWQMLGEAAEYVGLQLRDTKAGLDIVRAALERNPWYSPWLWNILGDCLFYQDKLSEAHQAFLQAQAIDPEDPRTNLNLAYTLSARGEQREALAAVARGLAEDGRGRGAYRPRLLEKQAQILTLLSERASAENERLIRRAERFR